jgi:hypothetical protein
MKYHGSFLQYTLGVRTVINDSFTLGASYKVPVAKRYAGRISIQGEDSGKVQRVGYNPGILGLGLEYRISPFTVYAEYRREFWGAGGSETRAGTPSSANTTDLIDTNILILGGRFGFGKGSSISATYGSYPSNVGIGGAQGEDHKDGVSFGEFDNLDREIYSTAYRQQFKEGQLQVGFNYQTGSKAVPAGYPGEGNYTLEVLTLAGGGSYYF